MNMRHVTTSYLYLDWFKRHFGPRCLAALTGHDLTALDVAAAGIRLLEYDRPRALLAIWAATRSMQRKCQWTVRELLAWELSPDERKTAWEEIIAVGGADELEEDAHPPEFKRG